MGKIIETGSILAITEIILRDSAKIHEEGRERTNKGFFFKPKERVSVKLIELINETIRIRATLVILLFASERLQILMFIL